jgi:Ca2+-binding EF-hand superfamily protein
MHTACRLVVTRAALDTKIFHSALDRLSVHMDPFVTYALDSLFAAFDRNEDGCVDVVDFGVGFTMLASGSKSDKLSLAFRLFDADGDGFLTKLELWKFFRSFLTMLVAIAKSPVSDEDIGLSESAIGSVSIGLTQVGVVTCCRNRQVLQRSCIHIYLLAS